MRYYYSDSGSTPVGPHSIDELRALQAEGRIQLSTWVIEEGGQKWVAWSDLNSLAIPSANPGPALSNSESLQNLPRNTGAIQVGETILWFLCCFPIGFMRWGQTAKGWIWFVIGVFSGGMGFGAALVDYWMCYAVQGKRPLGEWEFFPQR